MKNYLRYLLVIFIGFFFGIFVFLPINDLTSYYEYQPANQGYLGLAVYKRQPLAGNHAANAGKILVLSFFRWYNGKHFHAADASVQETKQAYYTIEK